MPYQNRWSKSSAGSHSWKLFNSHSDSFVANLSNGTFVTTPPPCGRTNIEAVVPCGDLDNAVNLELFRDTGSQRIRRRVERAEPYFLFGNSGSNVFDGRIEPGTYRIRANVNGIFTPFTTFTLQGPKCYWANYMLTDVGANYHGSRLWFYQETEERGGWIILKTKKETDDR